jgi:hypothetical protein
VVAGLTDPGQLVTQNRSSFEATTSVEIAADLLFFSFHVQLQGITMESTAVRRRPNCFNLVFQMRLMSKFGKDGAQELKAVPVKNDLSVAG